VIRYVLIKKMADLTGYSERAIREKVSTGAWQFTVKSPDGRVHIDIEEYEAWVSQNTKGVARRPNRQ
jgi:hypothetical protein